MLVTFGIAVYNVEKYVGICIESVIAIKDDNIEIIIVDDGSTDTSGQICDEYAKKDERIRVIHQPNLGVSSARNRIIDEAKGKWLSLVDGDDKISPMAMNYIRQYADDSCDAIYFDMHPFVFDDKITKYTVKASPMTVENSMLEDLMLSTMYTSKGSTDYINQNIRSVCGKIFKTELLKACGLRLNTSLPFAQDVDFNLHCIPHYNKVRLVRVMFYLYRQNPASTVHRYNPKLAKSVSTLTKSLNSFAEENPCGGKMLKRYYLRCAADMSSVIKQCYCHKKSNKTYIERKEEFDEFMKQPWCRTAIDNMDITQLKDKDKKAFSVYRTLDFKLTNRYYRNKERKEDIKVVLNKIGLNKILVPIKHALKRRR